MKCECCGEIIQYNPDKEFYVLSTNEFMWGEHCIYPMETQKVVCCSLKCLSTFIAGKYGGACPTCQAPLEEVQQNLAERTDTK